MSTYIPVFTCPKERCNNFVCDWLGFMWTCAKHGQFMKWQPQRQKLLADSDKQPKGGI